MSYVLNVKNLSTQGVAFGYSLAHEAMLSLHVFSDSHHHPLHVQWLISARKRVSKPLRSEMESFQFLYGRPIASFWDVDKNIGNTSFEEDMEWFHRQPIEEYIREITVVLLGRKFSWHELEQNSSLRDALFQKASRLPIRCEEAISQLLLDPERSKLRFIEFFTAYWTAVLKQESSSLEEMFQRDIERRGQDLLHRGVFERLSPDVSVDKTTEVVTIRRPSQSRISFSGDEVLFFVPSYFAWPHLLVRLSKPVILNYPAEDVLSESARPVLEEDLVKRFRALGDSTRMQILQRIAKGPSSTRELAGLLGFSEAAVSKHLKILQDAGLVRSRRTSYYVFYELHQGAMTGLDESLRGVLGVCDGI